MRQLTAKVWQGLGRNVALVYYIWCGFAQNTEVYVANEKQYMKHIRHCEDVAYSSVVECFLGMQEVLGSPREVKEYNMLNYKQALIMCICLCYFVCLHKGLNKRRWH